MEIPRTPKQQYTRKKLQMAALADTAEDKEEEMEGVTSLVMCPDLVDSKDNVSCVLHNLTTGQFSRILEQDLKRASIATVRWFKTAFETKKSVEWVLPFEPFP